MDTKRDRADMESTDGEKVVSPGAPIKLDALLVEEGAVSEEHTGHDKAGIGGGSAGGGEPILALVIELLPPLFQWRGIARAVQDTALIGGEKDVATEQIQLKIVGGGKGGEKGEAGLDAEGFPGGERGRLRIGRFEIKGDPVVPEGKGGGMGLGDAPDPGEAGRFAGMERFGNAEREDGFAGGLALPKGRRAGFRAPCEGAAEEQGGEETDGVG